MATRHVDLGTTPLNLVLAIKPRTKNSKQRRFHILHDMAMCAEAIEAERGRKFEAVLDVARWGERDAFTSADNNTYFDWNDVCHFCRCNLKRGLEYQQLRELDRAQDVS